MVAEPIYCMNDLGLKIEMSRNGRAVNPDQATSMCSAQRVLRLAGWHVVHADQG